MTLVPTGSAGFISSKGPLGFDTAIELSPDSCMSQSGWSRSSDPCTVNPSNCSDGISFSLWAILQLEGADVMFNRRNGTARYLISSGGDEFGHPGFSLYVDAHRLVALVSTGSQFWKVEVEGQLPNNSWVNLGVRWRSSQRDDDIPQGLQLFIDQRSVARMVLPAVALGRPRTGLQPPEIMIGCHRTSSDLLYRSTCPCVFDETAMWTRAINDTLFFLGGFDVRDVDMTPSSLLEQLMHCSRCSQDPQQFKAVMQKVLVLTNSPPPAPDTPAPSTDFSPAAGGQQLAEPNDADPPTASPGAPADVVIAQPNAIAQMKGLADLLVVMTEDAKVDMTPEELPLFLELVNIVNKMLEPENLPKWRGLEFGEKEDGGSAKMVNRFEDWALKSAENVHLSSAADVVFSRKETSHMELEVQKKKVFNLRQDPVVKYPTQTSRGLNVVEFATELFNNPNYPECAFADVNVLFAKYNTYGEISPRRVSTIGFTTNDVNLLELDGPVISAKVSVSGSNPALVSNCTPSAVQLRQYPVTVYIAHYNKLPALRKPLFHEDDIQSEIVLRSCVWWNDGLSDYGGWDATGCAAVTSSEFYTKCACHRFGQYGIMLEKVAPKVVDLEYEWLKIVKYVCYSVSCILLTIYIVTVIGFKQLREMFHLLRVNTAGALLLGSLCMCVTDLNAVRFDRHMCVAIGALVHFFYLLAAAAVAMEALADFFSIINGAIGGKFKSYLAFAWGIPFLSLGYAMYAYLPLYGTEPRCMVSWEDEVKWTMFAPLCACLCVSFILSCIIVCNMQSSWLRKENIAAEQLSVCRGLVFFCPYFCVNWVVGLLAYLHLGLDIPSFYPLFQVMNSTVGIMFFLFCGLGSDRFRLLIAGKAQLRSKAMLHLTVEEQLGESQDVLCPPEEEPSRPPTPDDTPYDPLAARTRKPLVA